MLNVIIEAERFPFSTRLKKFLKNDKQLLSIQETMM